MRKILIAGLAAVSLAFAGCADMGGIASNAQISATSEKVEIGAVKALIVSELAYQGANRVVMTGIAVGAIKGQRAADLQRLNKQALEALAVGYSAANAVEKAKAAARVMDLAMQMKTLADP